MRGGLALNKPVGISSFDIIRRLRQLLRTACKSGLEEKSGKGYRSSGKIDSTKGVADTGLTASTGSFANIMDTVCVTGGGTSVTSVTEGSSDSKDTTEDVGVTGSVTGGVTGRVKMGHAGTLDPAASGLMLILFGEATRVQHLLKDLDKEYVAIVHLGVETDTLDSEGEIVREAPVPDICIKEIKQALSLLQGRRMQRPPRYSALKVQGRRGYQKARAGEDFELPEREVNIFEIELLEWKPPFLSIRTRVSSGTYIRSLAAEIGHKLNLPASLASLVRTRVGTFRLADAFELDGLDVESVRGNMIPIERLLQHIPQKEIADDQCLRLLQGQPLVCRAEDELLNAPHCLLFSRNKSQAFLCEPREGMLWSRRLIYKDVCDE